MNATQNPSEPRTILRGFAELRCPLCGTATDAQRLDLADLYTFHCSGCEEEYTIDDVRQLLRQWQRVLTWIEAAPPLVS
jgi:hypothetical protein